MCQSSAFDGLPGLSAITWSDGPTAGTSTALQFGPILGLPGATGADSYGTAFRTARTPVRGLDPVALVSDLESPTQEEFAGAVPALAGQPVTGGAVVVENP